MNFSNFHKVSTTTALASATNCTFATKLKEIIMHVVLILLYNCVNVNGSMRLRLIFRLGAPQPDFMVNSTSRYQTVEWMRLHAIHDRFISVKDFNHFVCWSLPNKEVAIIRASRNVIPILTKEIRFFNVCLCVAMSNKAIFEVFGVRTPVLLNLK